MGVEAMSGGKAAILGRVRAARVGAIGIGAADAEWAGIERGYRRGAEMDRAAVLERFIDRLRDYDARVAVCSASDVAKHVGEMIAARGARRMVVPAGVPAEALPVGIAFETDHAGLSETALDGFDGVLTLCAVGIAETGTLVLQNAAGQGRRALSLVPDYHVCVVRAEDVVATVPEAFERLGTTAELATTFVSGPSATADIEMTRIKGVHGPRFLDVVLIETDAASTR
jgi:L-lactate dehydrogenase complex protein LldG